MAGRLAQEIKQSKPFATVAEEAVLNVMRTAEVLQQQMTELLKPYGISETQYNVLRILRGAGECGATCTQAAERMVTRDPDMTRLLDRLESRGFVRRERSKEDRRVVVTRITPEGLELLASLDAPIRQYLEAHIGRLGPERLGQLIDLLEELRQAS